MRLDDWFQGQTSRLPVLSTDLRQLDPWGAVLAALTKYECEQTEFGPFKFVSPAVRKYKKRKQDGKGFREINNPNASMRVIHKAFQLFMVAVMEAHLANDCWLNPGCKKRLQSFLGLPTAYAFKPGSTTAAAVVKHAQVRGRRISTIDIKSAYDSVCIELLTTILTGILLANRSSAITLCSNTQAVLYASVHDVFSDEEMLLWQKMYALLRRFFAVDKERGIGLIQGASPSPWLFNIVCEAVLNLPIKIMLYRKNEKRVAGREVIMTQYADDFCFTTREPGDIPVKEIRRLISNVFRINDGKVRHVNLDKDHAKVLGFSLGSNGRVIFPKKRREHLHVAIERAIRALKEKDPDWEKLYGKAMGYHSEFVTYLRMLETLKQPRTRSDENTLDRVDTLTTGWKPRRH